MKNLMLFNIAYVVLQLMLFISFMLFGMKWWVAFIALTVVYNLINFVLAHTKWFMNWVEKQVEDVCAS